jgi:hypothetical protein
MAFPPIVAAPGPAIPRTSPPTWTVGSVVGRTLAVLRGHAAPLLGAALIVRLPVVALESVVVAGSRAVPMMGGLASVLEAGLVAAGVATALRGERPRLGAMFRLVGARAGPLLGQAFISVAAIGLGLLLLVAPGLVAWSGFFVATPVVICEPGLGANDALTRSLELTRGRRRRILLVATIFMAWPLGIAFVSEAAAELVDLPPLAERAIELATLPFLVAYAACAAVVYEQLRVERGELAPAPQRAPSPR